MEFNGFIFKGGRRGCVEDAGVVKRMTGGGRLALIGVLGGGVIKMWLCGGVG